MNRPSLGVRVAGSPRGALALFLGYGAVWLGWYEGAVAWWLALGAVGAALRTLSAMGQVRRYNAWAAEWEAMGTIGGSNDPPPRKQPPRWRVLGLEAIGCGLLALVITVYARSKLNANSSVALGLGLLWLLACLGFVWKLAQLLLLFFRSRRSVTHGATQSKKAVEEDAVAWALECAVSSPSRQDAERDLPEHFNVRRVPSAPR